MECNGLDYVLDLVSELELCPAFPIHHSNLLKIGTRHHSPVEIDHHKSSNSTPRPQVGYFASYPLLVVKIFVLDSTTRTTKKNFKRSFTTSSCITTTTKLPEIFNIPS